MLQDEIDNINVRINNIENQLNELFSMWNPREEKENIIDSSEELENVEGDI